MDKLNSITKNMAATFACLAAMTLMILTACTKEGEGDSIAGTWTATYNGTTFTLEMYESTRTYLMSAGGMTDSGNYDPETGEMSSSDGVSFYTVKYNKSDDTLTLTDEDGATVVFARVGGKKDEDNPKTSSAGLKLISIKGGTITQEPPNRSSFGSFRGSFFDDDNLPVIVKDFQISDSEIPWALWKTVYDWSASKGYSFGNPGAKGWFYEREWTSYYGHKTIAEGANAKGSDLQPVVNISWYDAMVWCNAYTEWWNAQKGNSPAKAPAYIDADNGNPIKKAGQGTIDFKALLSATGFRLPTCSEWEYAARGGDPNKNAWNYIYSGSNAAGSVSWLFEDHKGTDVHYTHETSEVKKQEPNTAGIYDMSGNVQEWCYDDYESYKYRIVYGGSWESSYGEVIENTIMEPGKGDRSTGFRVVCSNGQSSFPGVTISGFPSDVIGDWSLAIFNTKPNSSLLKDILDNESFESVAVSASFRDSYVWSWLEVDLGWYNIERWLGSGNFYVCVFDEYNVAYTSNSPFTLTNGCGLIVYSPSSFTRTKY
jgi:formylglycine-generating enzyme required for sulfatase activity